jgi:predicted acyl esterase
MSDGGQIAVHRYAASGGPHPAVLQITPYRKEARLQEGWKFAQHGYDLFVADVRGFGGSRGDYHGFLSDREIQDGVELIEWIARQPFCTGKVGTIGGSYTGCNQMLIAARKPKGLTCIAPTVGPVDTYRDWTRRGGIVSFAIWGMTYFRGGQAETIKRGLQHYYMDVMANPFDNPIHYGRSPEYILSKIEAPAFLIGGWDDYFIRGTIRSFLNIPAPRRLLIGPWGHGNSGSDEETFRWLDYWLKGEGSNPTTTRRVRLFQTGSKEWIERDDWFNFERAQWLPWQPFKQPAETQVAPAFAGYPLPTNIRAVLPPESGYSHWPEILTTDGDPLKQATVIDGPLAAELHVDCAECEDFEVHVRLSVVGSDNTCVQLSEGRLRATHRTIDLSKSYTNVDGFPILPWHKHERVEALEPGKTTVLHIEMNPICHRFAPGDRMRLGLSLIRADERAIPVAVKIGSGTRVLLPVTTGTD